MPDNKRKIGHQDRAKAAGLQRYEVYYIAHKFNVTPDKVRAIIRHVGNIRKAVYGALQLAKEN